MCIVPSGYVTTTQTLFNALEHQVAKVQAPFTTWQGYPIIILTDLVHKAITVGIIIPLALIEQAILITQVYNNYVNGKFLEKLIAYYSLNPFNAMLLSSLVSLPKRKSAEIIEITSLYHHHIALSQLIQYTKEWGEEDLTLSACLEMAIKLSCAKHREYFTHREDKEAIISHLKSTQQFEAVFDALYSLIIYYACLSRVATPFSILSRILFNPFTIASNGYVEWIDSTRHSIDALEEALDGRIETIDEIVNSSTIKKVQEILDRIKMGKSSVILLEMPLFNWSLYSVRNQITRSSIEATIDWFMENHEDWMTDEIWNDIMQGQFYEAPQAFANMHVLLELANGSLDNDPLGLTDTDHSIFNKYSRLTLDQKRALNKRLVTQIDDSNGATDELYRYITTRGSKMMSGPTFIANVVMPALEKRNIQERG